MLNFDDYLKSITLDYYTEIDWMSDNQRLVRILKKLKENIKFSIQNAKKTPAILIHGCPGSGKGVLARAIHNTIVEETALIDKEKAKKIKNAFSHPNMPSIPSSLFDAEFFGSARGIADDRKPIPGYMDKVLEGGTIFMDEIGVLDNTHQAKLNQVLQDRYYTRVTAGDITHTKCWFIAATNIDINKEIKKHNCRPDLFRERFAVSIKLLPPNRKQILKILSVYEKEINCTIEDKAKEKIAEKDISLRKVIQILDGALSEKRNAQGKIIIDLGELNDSLMLDESLDESCPTEGYDLSSSPRSGQMMELFHTIDNKWGDFLWNYELPAELNLSELMERIEVVMVYKALSASGNNHKEAALRLGYSPTQFTHHKKKYIEAIKRIHGTG